MLRVNTIYPAFMGEVNAFGIGVPCTFIRLAGCNLRCYSNKGFTCDTPEALEVTHGKEMPIVTIFDHVCFYGHEVICLTGGEPLMQDCSELLEELTASGYKVVVETNGSFPIHQYRHIRNVHFVVDYKSPSTGETKKMVDSNWAIMDEDDYLKFVIDTNEDFDSMIQWVKDHEASYNGKVAAGCFWGSNMGYQELASRILRSGLNTQIYLNMQTHKMMCLYDKFKNSAVKDIMIPKNL